MTYVERAWLGVDVEAAQVALLEADVRKPSLAGLGLGVGDGIRGEVVAAERAAREPLREQHERPPAPTPEIEDRDSLVEPLGHPRDERQDVREQH